MTIREISESHTLAERMNRAADNLMWCLSERFFARDGHEGVMRGHNECVSLYCCPSEKQAGALAEKLEQIVAPVRTENALRLLDDIDKLSAAIRQAVKTGS